MTRTLILILISLFVVRQTSAQGTDIPLEEATVRVNGIELFYRTAGSGPPLLLLHGFRGVGADWEVILKPLIEKYTVIMPDLRGHGRSTNPSGVFLYRDSARDILGLLDHLRLDSVAALGYSAGSLILLHMASQQPEKLQAMVLMAGAHRLTPEARKEGRETPLLEDSSAENLTYFRKVHPRGDGQIRMLLAQSRAFSDDYESFEFSPEHLASIAVRTLIVVGDRDQVFPMSVITELYESLPKASLWVIPGVTHGYFWSEREKYYGLPGFFSTDWWPPFERFLEAQGAE